MEPNRFINVGLAKSASFIQRRRSKVFNDFLGRKKIKLSKLSKEELITMIGTLNSNNDKIERCIRFGYRFGLSFSEETILWRRVDFNNIKLQLVKGVLSELPKL